MGLLHRDAGSGALARLSCFRGGFYCCLTARSDALFELADAVLCGGGPVRSLAELSLVGEHRRGDGGLYAAVAWDVSMPVGCTGTGESATAAGC